MFGIKGVVIQELERYADRREFDVHCVEDGS